MGMDSQDTGFQPREIPPSISGRGNVTALDWEPVVRK